MQFEQTAGIEPPENRSREKFPKQPHPRQRILGGNHFLQRKNEQANRGMLARKARELVCNREESWG